METKALNPQSRRLKISASAVRFRPSPPPIFLLIQGNPPFQTPGNSAKCLAIPGFFWSQNGHSDKASGGFDKSNPYFSRTHSGHNQFDKIAHKPYLLISGGIMMGTKVLILGLICLLMLGCALSVKKEISNVNWRELFTEPFEIAYVIMKDGATFPHTSKHDVMVDMSIGKLEEKLRKVKGKNYSIKEIAIVIHSHQMKKSFGQEDWRQYHMLKSYGFNGRFLLYCHRTKKVYSIQ